MSHRRAAGTRQEDEDKEDERGRTLAPVRPHHPPEASTFVIAIIQKVRRSPKAQSVIGLWVLGLFIMFLAPAPVKISTEMRANYENLVDQAEQLDKFGDTRDELRLAQNHMSEAQVWFWRWRSPYNEMVAERRKVVDTLQAKVDAVQAEKDKLLLQANQQVGIWSDYGIAEARDRFWSAFESGKVFAKRQTFWNMILSLLNTRENVASILLEWIFVAMMNFTLGLVGSVFYFVFSLSALISNFAANPVSGLAFFAVGMLGAVSVVATYLLAIYSVGAGGVYTLHRVAQRHAALEGRRREQLAGRGR